MSLAAVLAQRAQAASQANWNQIASYYAGQPVTVNFPGQSYMQGYEGRFDPNQPTRINLAPDVRAGLSAFAAHKAAANDQAIRSLVTLLHEGLRSHGTLPADGSKFQDKLRNQDYWSAQAGSVSLLPDLLQRYFKIPLNSKLERNYYRTALSLFSPEKILRPPSTQYQTVMNDRDWSGWRAPTSMTAWG